MSITSNLGDELANGMKAQVSKKIAEAEGKLQALVDEKIKGPQAELLGQLKGNGDFLSQIKNADQLYKANEGKIKTEIANLQKGGGKGKGGLEEQGKKLLKKFKF
jgi:hypothetical protein